MVDILRPEGSAAIAKLPERDALVLRSCYGLDGFRIHTIEQVAAQLGLSRDRVRQLRDRAYAKIVYYGNESE